MNRSLILLCIQLGFAAAAAPTRAQSIRREPEAVDTHAGHDAAIRARAELAASPPRTDAGPPPFGAGSMGGYWTLAEIKQKLDALVANDAAGVVADKIDTLGTTSHGRPIWGLRLGRYAPGPGGPPVAYYNALTHATEPMGMEVLLAFVDNLVARYGVDPTVTYLLDHRALYLVPVVNPDGAAYNESYYSTNHDFGFWRKNLADLNHNGTFDLCCDGVDLNRNYGYQWGYDNVGSDSASYSTAYRGPAPWSEPETRAQRDVIAALRPATGLSFHSYQDVIMHPWGWTIAPVPGADLDAFREWSDLLVRDNAYQTGSENQVLYPVNGEFNDWCYGDTLLKPRFYTWTAEVGSNDDGFNPPPSRMKPLADEMLNTCTVIAELAGPWVRASRSGLLEPAMPAGDAATLRVLARNRGLQATPGAVDATISPIDAGGRVWAAHASYPALDPRSESWPADDGAFVIGAADTVTPGRMLRFQIDFATPEGFLSRDTVAVPCGVPTLMAFDYATAGLAKWNPGTWGITSDGGHPAPYFTDSPNGVYANNVTNAMLLTAPLDLTHGVHAYATYGARWDVQRDYDAATVEASRNGSTWTRLAATGTVLGSGMSTAQVAGQPAYAGTRWNWARERVDLSRFTGAGSNAVRFRFTEQTDGSAQYDGFAFDSLRIELYDPAAQPTPVAVGEAPAARQPELNAIAPNPARGSLRLEFSMPRAGTARLEVLDLAGRCTRILASGAFAAGRYAHAWDGRDAAGRPVQPGVYWLRLATPDGAALRRVVELR